MNEGTPYLGPSGTSPVERGVLDGHKGVPVGRYQGRRVVRGVRKDRTDCALVMHSFSWREREGVRSGTIDTRV